MEATCSYEMSVDFQRPTHHITEDRTLQTKTLAYMQFVVKGLDIHT
jgi:hypothetical protein